jgi:hypothetical protein
MDVGTFQAAYGAFRTTDPLVVSAALGRATRMHSADVWGAQLDDGIGLLCAHYLTVDPFGSTTALVPGQGSTYLDQWKEMRRAVVGGGFGVAGGRGGWCRP